MFDTLPHVLRASAGTGKTYQLVQTYLHLVQHEGLRPNEIVAITFTRKAAAELRARISAALQQAGVHPAILEDLDRAPLVNFHGLCLRLVGEQDQDEGPKDILGEDGEDRQLFLEACELAWFHGDAPTAAAVQMLAPHFELAEELPQALWTAYGRAREDGHTDFVARFAQYDPFGVVAAVHHQLLEVRAHLCAALPHMEGAGRAKLQAFAQALPPAADAPAPIFCDAWQRAFAHVDRRGKLRHIYTDAAANLVKQQLPMVLAEEVCARLRESLMHVCQRALATYAEEKQQLGGQDFTDLVMRAVAMLEQGHPQALALQTRTRAVLLDEAQDTNALQRRLVDLVARMPSEVRKPAAAKLIAVGDWKQSIYTFRGAHPQSFARIAESCALRGGTQDTLAYSRRSHPHLVAGINDLGAHLFGEDYEPLLPLDVPAEVAAQTDAGMAWLTVAGHPSTTPAAQAEADGVAAFIAQQVAAGEAPGDMAILLATMGEAPRYAAALQAHHLACVQSGGGAFELQPHVREVVAHLQALIDPQAHLAAATCLRSPLWGCSDSLLFALFGGAFGGASPTAWQKLRAGIITPELAAQPLAATDHAMLAQIAQLWPQLGGVANAQGALALLRCLDATLHVRAVYAQVTQTPAQVDIDLDYLDELAHQSDVRHGSFVAPFVQRHLRRLEQGMLRPLPSVRGRLQRDYVTLSSVHQSKGLAYKTVILPGLGKKGSVDAACLSYSAKVGVTFRPRLAGSLRHSRASQAVALGASEEKKHELRRLLYVAMTRGERRVLFVSDAPPDDLATLAQGNFGSALQGWPAGALHRGTLRLQPAASQLQPAASAPVPRLMQHTRLRAQPSAQSQTRMGVGDLTANLVAGPPAAPLTAPARARNTFAQAALGAVDQWAAGVSPATFVDTALQGWEEAAAGKQALCAHLLSFFQSPLACRVRQAGLDRYRTRVPFACQLASAPYVTLLHGSIDLVFWDAEGPVMVIYKYTSAPKVPMVAHQLQLDAYAWALSHLLQHPQSVRANLVYVYDCAAPIEQHIGPDRQTRLVRTWDQWAQRGGGALPILSENFCSPRC